MKLEPPPTWDEYHEWNKTSTRPATDKLFGEPSTARRNRCAEHSHYVLGHERPRRKLVVSPWTGRSYLV